MQESTFHPVGILLCAGRGSRFDPSGERDKLMQILPNGEAVAQVSAKKLLAATGQVVAVVREGRQELERVLKAVGCEVVVCRGASLGMSASLKCGLLHADHARAWLLALADMPFVESSTYRALLSALQAGSSKVAPTQADRRGNPVGFARANLHALLSLDGDAGARSLLTGPELTLVPVQDPGIHRDIDTPADLM